MTARTPTALKWLLDKRSRLAGCIEKCTNDLAIAETRRSDLKGELARLKRLILAVDQTIGLHEIGVDPELISDTRSKKPALFGHGKITKIVLQSLRDQPPRWVTTGEMIELICTGALVSQDDYDQPYLRRLIRCRLQAMSRTGLLERAGCKPHAEQRWRLSKSRFGLARGYEIDGATRAHL